VPISIAYDASTVMTGARRQPAPCVLSVYGAYGKQDDLGWTPSRCVHEKRVLMEGRMIWGGHPQDVHCKGLL